MGTQQSTPNNQAQQYLSWLSDHGRQLQNHGDWNGMRNLQEGNDNHHHRVKCQITQMMRSFFFPSDTRQNAQCTYDASMFLLCKSYLICFKVLKLTEAQGQLSPEISSSFSKPPFWKVRQTQSRAEGSENKWAKRFSIAKQNDYDTCDMSQCQKSALSKSPWPRWLRRAASPKRNSTGQRGVSLDNFDFKNITSEVVAKTSWLDNSNFHHQQILSPWNCLTSKLFTSHLSTANDPDL